VVHAPAETVKLFEGVDAAELFITSGASFTDADAPAGAFTLEDVKSVAVVPALAGGEKCERCYQVLDEVGADAAHPTVCNRCADATDNFQAVAESA